MTHSFSLSAATAAMLLATGCVEGGMIAMEAPGDPIAIRGLVLLGGEHEHDDEHDEDAEHAEEPEDEHEAGEPLVGLPIALIVAADGVGAWSETGTEGDFAFEPPAGVYHLGFSLPANLGDSGAGTTDFLLRVETSDEPLGVELVLLPEADESAWHVAIHVFDDEDGDGLHGADEAVLEEVVVDVPYGSRRDLVLNPEPAEPADDDDDHGHSHG